jgi:hypothetical protein
MTGVNESDTWYVVQVVDAPMLPTKFLYLKHLTIHLPSASISRPYDYFSLVSFLEASPSLETLTLDVRRGAVHSFHSAKLSDQSGSILLKSYYPFHRQVTSLRMAHESIFADSELRHMAEHHHASLKSVKISGFSSAKSLVELTCYILENAVSLECPTVDTIYGPRCYDESKFKYCIPIADGVLMETPRALSAIRTYIENKVPSTVKLTVMEPCSLCHATGKWRILLQSGNSISNLILDEAGSVWRVFFLRESVWRVGVGW